MTSDSSRAQAKSTGGSAPVSLHVVDEGTGVPVLLIHGLMMSGALFRHQREAFATSKRRLIVPDLRGHGRSPKPLSGHTVPMYAEDVCQLLREREVRRPVVVGWSMGAMVALEIVRILGEAEVAGVVIVDQPPTDYRWPDYPSGLLDSRQLAELVEAIQTDLPSFARSFVPHMLHVPEAGVVEWIVNEMCAVPPAIGSTIAVDQTFRDYRILLDELSLPMAAFFGADPKFVDPATSAELFGEMTNCQFTLFDGSSHCPFLEEPDRFNTELEAFIQRVGD